MNKFIPWLVTGGVMLILLTVGLLFSSRAINHTDVPTSSISVPGDIYTVRVDPHSDRPVGSVTIVLIKKDGVEGNIKVDPVYAELARQTGGSVNVADPEKFSGNELADHMFAIMTVDLTKENESLFATGAVATRGSLRLLVYMPDGNLYTGKSKNNAGSEFFNIASPAPGDWKVVVSGEGAYELHAAVGVDKDFYKVAFVELGGRPGHQGLFPIERALVAGKKSILQVVALSEITDLKAYYKLANQKLVEISRLADGRDVDESYFEGSVPTEPFTVLLHWTDTKTQNRIEREFYPATSPE